MTEKGPKNIGHKTFHRKMHLSIFLTTHVISIETTMHIMAYNGSQDKIDDICRNWQPLSSACSLRSGHRGSQADNSRNGRKWSKKVHRGYLVGNGFLACLASFHYYFQKL